MPINRHLQRSIMFDKSHAIESIGEWALGYSWAKKEEYKTPNFVIYGEKGSVGETHANKNGFYSREQ